MSITTELSRIQANRNTIRAKLVELGMATSADKLDALASAFEGIVNRGAVSVELLEGTTYTIPAGYRNGSGVVKAMTDTAGESEKYKTQAKTVTPTTEEQIVTPDDGYYALSSVTVEAAEIGGDVKTVYPTWLGGVAESNMDMSRRFNSVADASMKADFNGTILPMPPFTPGFPYRAIVLWGKLYLLAECAGKMFFDSAIGTGAALNQSDGNMAYSTFNNTKQIWNANKSGNYYFDINGIIWSNYDIPNGSPSAAEVYFPASGNPIPQI